jgi:hypothetical protein
MLGLMGACALISQIAPRKSIVAHDSLVQNLSSSY